MTQHNPNQNFRNFFSKIEKLILSKGAQGWYIGMTHRDGMGREMGGGFWIGSTCTPMADSCECMQKPPQHCKVIHLQLK